MSFSRQLRGLVDCLSLAVLALLVLGVPVFPGLLAAAESGGSGEVCAMACSLDGGNCCCIPPSRSRQRFESAEAEGVTTQDPHAGHASAGHGHASMEHASSDSGVQSHHGSVAHAAAKPLDPGHSGHESHSAGHSGHEGHSAGHTGHDASAPGAHEDPSAPHAHLWAIELDLSSPQPCPGVAGATGAQGPTSARSSRAPVSVDTGVGCLDGGRNEGVRETRLDLAVLPRPPPVLAV